MTEPPFARRRQAMRSVVAVRLDRLGERLTTTPVLRALEAHRPGPRLHARALPDRSGVCHGVTVAQVVGAARDMLVAHAAQPASAGAAA